MDVMMGDLVLTQDEVNPVMSGVARQRSRTRPRCTTISFGRTRMFYMHVHGHGSPTELARKVKPALDLIGKGGRPGAPPAAGTPTPTPAIDTAKMAQIAGHQGETNGAVYKITVGRDDLKLTEMGAPIKCADGPEHMGRVRRHERERRDCR